MFASVLVANRGEIARRVIRTAAAMGIRSIAVYSEADADLPFVAEADEAVLLGPAAPAASYRDADAVLAAARSTGAAAVHPGYGFLSEDAGFARAVLDAGLVWVGPPPAAIAAMGDKIAARALMSAAGVPVVPGSAAAVSSVADAAAVAEAVGYPVIVKAAAGGGGMGMAVVDGPEGLPGAVDRVSGVAARLFGDPAVFVERWFARSRHVEVQILGLPDGRVLALGERDCSVQRRHQKLAEETPSPAFAGPDDPVRHALLAAARDAGRAVDYRGAGTVEFLLAGHGPQASFHFLEMNTRLQVEHPITEAVLGVDLVRAQFRIAAGEDVGFDETSAVPSGHALELRINAEDPRRFLPGPGVISAWVEPTGEGIRVDAGYVTGNTVTPHYDSLLAKLIVHGPDRATVLERARAAVAAFTVAGPKNNLAFHAELLEHPEFVSGSYDTGIVGRMRA
ncbi:acetyl-CoA carboxylase biotin carboxylase subunit [Nakamurella deserti]|uniref:acetyl-CoA carboxylase biotin carboxylase subunit n=1 Tax=Nakamurella deserti TaxID=2164074 RepID=UPI000DBE155C|nr:biotin carboxylase N-terminal domain-containing protein [Nakamurella deserti]